MRYADIDECEICNGLNVGISLFVQGCHRHCFNCFNPETWDFNGGKEWSQEVEDKFFKLINRPYIKRVSFLGGDPLEPENLETISDLIVKIKSEFPQKKIWLYTGKNLTVTDFLRSAESYSPLISDYYWYKSIQSCDIIVDGDYQDDKRDLTLPFRGSSNQRLIDVKKTIENSEITLYEVK